MDTRIIRYCAEEVERQHDGPLAVADMCEAYDWLNEYEKHEVTITMVRTVHALTMPRLPFPGQFRTVPALFDGGAKAMDAALIPRAMDALMEAVGTISADDFYHEFESIHPFVDGNGRVGSLLWNYMSDTLGHPTAPPEYDSHHDYDLEAWLEDHPGAGLTTLGD